jgi:hypothetical protein
MSSRATAEFAICLILLSGILGVGCQVMTWTECRRVHPFWYCLIQ